MNTNTRTVYKVVRLRRGVRRSLLAQDLAVCYPQNEWVEAPRLETGEETLLFCFQTLDTARRYLACQWHPDGYEIWKCEAEDLEAPPLTIPACARDHGNFWRASPSPGRVRFARSWWADTPPEGTLLAKRVKLVKRKTSAAEEWQKAQAGYMGPR